MDILRCKTPDMIRKELWAHLLAYNLLRTVMAVVAEEKDIKPQQVSFKGAKQAVTAFAPKIEVARPEDRRGTHRCDADNHRLSSCRQPSWTMGATWPKTQPEESEQAHPTS